MREPDEAVSVIALRYVGFYGAINDALVKAVRKRRFPIIGDCGRFTSWIQSMTPPPQPCSRSSAKALQGLVEPLIGN